MFRKKLTFFLLVTFLSSLMPNVGFAKTTQPESEYIGYHDATTCDVVKGWARYKKSKDPVVIGIFLDYISLIPMTRKIAEVKADVWRPDIPGNFGFAWTMPEELKNQHHDFFIYILDESGNPIQKLNHTGQGVYCGPKEIDLKPGDVIEIVKNGFQPRVGPGLEKAVAWSNPFRMQGSKGVVDGMVFPVVATTTDSIGNMWVELNPGVYPKKGLPLKIPQRVRSIRWFMPAEGAMMRKAPTRMDELARQYDEIPGELNVELDLSDKKFIVKKGEETIYDWTCVVIGMNGTPTPKGRFKLVDEWRVINRYMQGRDFDIPGVGYVQYLILASEDGETIIIIEQKGQGFHEAESWRENLETDYCKQGSHGCINTAGGVGRWLYLLFLGKTVDVYIHE